MPGSKATARRLFTIGHSTRPLVEFIALLSMHDIGTLVDIRTVPKSRRYPHFAQENLGPGLAAAGIEYRYLKDLGGLRRPLRDSDNTGWRNASFRGYADHMQTPQFECALDTLVEIAERRTSAIMCAEAVPWRCHRSLVGDALLVRGFEVLDIISDRSLKPHTLTSFARVDGTRITYPPDTEREAEPDAEPNALER